MSCAMHTSDAAGCVACSRYRIAKELKNEEAKLLKELTIATAKAVARSLKDAAEVRALLRELETK